MGLLDLRDLVSFPHGDNSSDTLVNGVHLNLTALRHWNYTLYSNNTISNNSNCFIIFGQYKPAGLFPNGTWVNATSCYVPIYGIRERGKLGVVFAVLFAVSIFFTLMNLKKHGQQFLREDKRFRLVGRRWQWYWMLFVAGCGIISCFTSVDEDRDYLQQISIVLQSLFYMLMVPGAMAMVWEGTRHWGSWQERQIIDVDPFSLPQDDRRGKAEFYMPLVFYLFAWLNFFMTIPRSWSPLEMQSSIQQDHDIAEPAATDGRFKAAGILAAFAYATIIYNLSHSLYYYKPHAGGWWRAFDNALLHTPARIFFSLIVLGVFIAYNIVAAWEWSISIMRYDAQPAWPYGLGYVPCLVIIIILNVGGALEENEDLQLIAQRRARGRHADAALGITKKPAWWSKLSGDAHSFYATPEERLRALASEGPVASAAQRRADFELRAMDRSNNPDVHLHRNTELGARGTVSSPGATGLRDRSRSRPREDEDPFRDASPADQSARGRLDASRPAVGREQSAASNSTMGSALTGSTVNAPAQRVRSMLDV